MFRSLVLKNQFGEQSNNFLIGGQLDFNFIVDPTNGNGLGIRSLKGSPIVKNVFMHTSATPASGNPNPASGLILVEFSQSFSGFVVGGYGFGSPLSGTPINVTAGLTAGDAYVITSVGTTTPAQWQTLGLPSNIVPAVGASFIAITNSAGVGTGVVETVTDSGIMSIETVGDPNQMCNNNPAGAYQILQCLNASSSLTAPAANTVVALTAAFSLPSGDVI